MSDDWKRLRSADPVPTAATPPKDLLARITQSRREQRTTRKRRWRLRGILNLLAALAAMVVVGYGVAWAATGHRPLSGPYSEGLTLAISDYGLEQFAALEPATDETIATIPQRTLMPLQAQRFMARDIEYLRRHGRFPSRKKQMEVPPGEITAVGHVETAQGTPFSLVVMNGKLCWNDWRGGNCADVESIEKRGVINWGSEWDKPRLSRVTGIFTDRVASILVNGREIPVPENVFEIRNVPMRNLQIIALDDQGKEVLRTGVPIGDMGPP